jgi:hypothetical protein
MTITVADRTTGAGKLQQGDVGKKFHLGIGSGSPLNMYGYNVLRKDYGGSGYAKRTDVQSRDQLISVASPNITDRDLARTPRVTEGDFSGGILQQLFVNPRQSYDSDLEIRVHGNLQLRPAWVRKTVKTALTTRLSPNISRSVTFGGDVYTTWGEVGGGIYNSAGNLAATYDTYSMDSDGQYLYGADRSGNLWYYNGTAFATLANGFPVNIDNLWAVYLGTAGRFLYFVTNPVSGGIQGTSVLQRIDLSAVFPLAPANVVAVPLGSFTGKIVDLVPYNGGIAILVNDLRHDYMTVWYHDGYNLQLILKIRSYAGVGICDCLGQLYVTAQSLGSLEPPVLLQVASSTFSVVARMGSQLPGGVRSSLNIGAPVSSGQYVGFAVQNPAINGVTSTSYVVVFDVLEQAVSHLPNLDANDNPGISTQNLCWLGRAVFLPYVLSGNGVMQYQTNQLVWIPGGTVAQFASTGRVVSPLHDFNTPGIAKRFRRVLAHHAPLNPGESITVQAFLGLDPTKYQAGVTTPTATVTHSYGVSDTAPSDTILNLPSPSLALSMYFVVVLNAGTNQQTTPTIYWVSIEAAPGWTFEFWVGCNSATKTLNGEDDPQSLTGTDRYGQIHNAWENGQPLTLWSPEGNVYTCVIQEGDFHADNPIFREDVQAPQDHEYFVRLVLSEAVV